MWGYKRGSGMNVTVIRVSMFEGKSYDAMKPLIFPIIASLTPETVKIDFLDDRIETLPEYLPSDMIVLSFDTFSAKRAYQLARRYKREENLVVLGGFHASMLPDEAADYGDVVLVGDAEDTWPLLIDDVLKGEVKPLYNSKGDCELSYIDPNHSSFKGKRYQKIGVVQFSRGCKFGCDFCSIKAMYPHEVRQKDIKLMIREIKETKERLFFFIDDNLFFNEETTLQLLQALKQCKKRWACQISIDIAMNDKLLKLMKESGCLLVLIGFESLDAKNLIHMKKAANLATQYEEAIKNIYKHRLMIYATFVLGYDEDTNESFEETFQFAMKHHFAVANFNPLIPMPGTSLYKRMEKENRLIYKAWWTNSQCCYGDTVYEPKKLTPFELRDGCKKIRYQFYGVKNIIKRMLGNPLHLQPFHLGVYLILNIISAIEIRRKQGKQLGGGRDEVSINQTKHWETRT